MKMSCRNTLLEEVFYSYNESLLYEPLPYSDMSDVILISYIIQLQTGMTHPNYPDECEYLA